MTPPEPQLDFSNNLAYASSIAEVSKEEGHRQFQRLLRLRCSAKRHQSRLPFVLAHGGGLSKAHIKALEKFNVEVVQYEQMMRLVKSFYKPIYTEKEAFEKKRLYNPNYPEPDQPKNGWKSYFKLFLWRQKE